MLSDLMSRHYLFIILYSADQCIITKISVTKLSIEFKDNSLFEEKVTDFKRLTDSLNNILAYKDALVTTVIFPRKVKYREFEAALPSVAANLRKDRIESIIDERIRFYYHNALILWFANRLMEANYNVDTINLSRYYVDLSPNININQDDYQLSMVDDIKTDTATEVL